MSSFTGVIVNAVADIADASLQGNQLRSRSYARLVDLVSEGEVEGLVNGAKSVYLNGTRLQNDDGTYNFKGVSIEARPGTNAQTYIAGIPSVESETNLNLELTKATALTRSISNTDVNAVRVTMSVPALYRQKDDGSIVGTEVEIAIDVQDNGGGYVEVFTDTISGKAQSKYQRSYRVPLTGTGPWYVRLRRITNDSTSLTLQNKTYWDSYTEIIDTKLRYPNSAIAYVKVDSKEFDGVPSRGYDMKLLKVKVPSNYNPTTRVYTGSWDGTFTTAWTDNPAWCFYDLVTNSRYGIGEYIDALQIDKWGLYTIGQYCDELVPDGFGGTEPRFTCNMYLQTREQAYKVIQDMASCFRSMVYWATGSMTLAQDAPGDPVALFTQANVADGVFRYSGSSAKARHTVAMVTWNDPDDMYSQKVEYVEDEDAIARFGVVPTEVIAVGCTSRGQANRVGRWLLFSERYESDTVTFATGAEGAVVRPGNVIKVADASRAGTRLGGRVHSATTTAITLDAAVDLGVSSWTLYAMLPNGAVESRTVSGAVGSVVSVTSAFTSAPQAGAQWIMSTSTVEAQTFRVLSITEQESGVYEITALKHDPEKYDVVENGLVLQPRDITSLSITPDAPGTLSTSESLYTYQAEVRAMVTVGWQSVQYATSYRVMWSADGSNYTEAVTSANSYDLLNITPGVYTFNVYSVGPTGKQSASFATTSITALGKTAPPANVTGFTSIIDPNIGVTLSWNRVADLDVDMYEVRDGSSWATATLVGKVKGTTIKIGLVAASSKTYLVKALDTSGIYSTSTASTTVTISAAGQPTVTAAFAGENVVLSWGAVAGSLATQAYEIRYGSTFGAGTSLGTIKGTTFQSKATWSGVRKFWVTAIDIADNYGTAGPVDVTVTPPVPVSVVQEVIDNNVLLRWGDATQTLPIDYYEVRRGASWAGGTVIGKISSRFSVVFESIAGTYLYWVQGVDVAGNAGTPSYVTATVSQPPDYVLQLNQDSTFSGTKSNLMIENGAMIGPADTTDTWQSHFTARSWTTPQAQVDAGYPLYIEPSTSAGYYEETIDYGGVLAATKITTTLSYTTVAGAVTVTPTISVKKLAGDAWTNYAGMNSVYVADFRYMKVRYDFASSGGDDIISITGLNVRFDVKLKNDAGVVTASSSDSGGTTVAFNVSFVDVNSITVTPKGTAARIAVYDFVDAPNPTSFKVLLFDTAGTRVSGDVSWSAKGV